MFLKKQSEGRTLFGQYSYFLQLILWEPAFPCFSECTDFELTLEPEVVLFPVEGKSTQTHLKAVFACTWEWFAVLGSSVPSLLATPSKLQMRAEQSSLSSLPPFALILLVNGCTWTELKDTWIPPHLCKHLAMNTDWQGREGPNPNTKGPGQAAQLYLHTFIYLRLPRCNEWL